LQNLSLILNEYKLLKNLILRDSEVFDTRLCGEFYTPFWCRGGHAQTICSSLFKPVANIDSERIRINTPDEDFLDMDLKENPDSGKAAILFHGLEGSSRRFYITNLSDELYQNGYTVIAVNFRSCSGDMNRNPRFYHSGETEDLATVFTWVSKNLPDHRLFAAGFSLGASALLNFLRRHQTAHPLEAVAGISTPFDLKKGSLNLNNGFNQIYNHYFLNSLKKKIEEKRKIFPDIPRFTGNSLYEFDDQVTAPLHGFKNADHYYETCSSAFFMDQIRSPVLIVHSKADPLCPFHLTPTGSLLQNPNITSCIVDDGGHVGFWGTSKNWLEKNIVTFFNQFGT
jgi:uncharacterized protein